MWIHDTNILHISVVDHHDKLETLTLRSILEKDKFDETNFVDWYVNLRNVLKSKKEKLYVLNGTLPNFMSLRLPPLGLKGTTW